MFGRLLRGQTLSQGCASFLSELIIPCVPSTTLRKGGSAKNWGLAPTDTHKGPRPYTLTFTRNYTRQVRVEVRVGPLPTDLADGAIRARAFSIRGAHRFCVPDSLPTGQSFSNTARSSSPRRFLPS